MLNLKLNPNKMEVLVAELCSCLGVGTSGALPRKDQVCRLGVLLDLALACYFKSRWCRWLRVPTASFG